MTREQRYRYDTLRRIRDFGAAHLTEFPESSPGGQMFGQVAAAVDAVEAHVSTQVLASAEGRKIKATTRARVTRYLQALAFTGKRVANAEAAANPFRMPSRKSAASVLATARAFIGEAQKREAQFVQFGLPPGFISEFRSHVDELDRAVEVQLNSKSRRREALRGVANALARGFDAVHNLDAVVANVLRDEPTKLAAWEGARRIEGLKRGLGATTLAAPPPPAVPAAVPASGGQAALSASGVPGAPASEA